MLCSFSEHTQTNQVDDGVFIITSLLLIQKSGNRESANKHIPEFPLLLQNKRPLHI